MMITVETLSNIRSRSIVLAGALCVATHIGCIQPPRRTLLAEPTVQRIGPVSPAAEPFGVLAPPGDEQVCPPRSVYAGNPVNLDPDYPAKILDKCFFTLGYSEHRMSPAWVAYRLGPAVDLTGHPRRRFAIDGETDARVSHDDYTRSGFDRGHMAPRFGISSRYGRPGNDATFVMSNVCPQYHSFNDGQWGDLEEWIAGRRCGRRFIPGWADVLEEVWVTVGPIFDEDRDPLPSGVEVPNAFYCIVLDEDSMGPRAIAFIMEHIDVREYELVPFLTSVDEIERRSGLDFFSELDDDLEDELEDYIESNLWELAEQPN
jgi:endonuclease G